jgi:hypothetical protein
MSRSKLMPLSVVGSVALAGFLLTSCDVPPAEEDSNPVARERSALTTPASCSINLVDNTHTCAGISAISFVAAPSAGKAVVRINLSSYSSARIRTYYNSTPTGWVVNIGDSVSNNGYGGDSGNQSNDSELQILNQNLTVYASDYGQNKVVGTHANAANASSYNDFYIADRSLVWSVGRLKVGHIPIDSSNLFALKGEPDGEGPVNYDIYASFNRVIGSASRSGSGCNQVDIYLE